jgi:imidazolonepropionase-like amidohydrolase
MPKRTSIFVLFAWLLASVPMAAQTIDALSPQVKKYVSVSTPRTVLTHVEVIDGTSAPPVADQNITIETGKITAISPGRDLPASEGTTILNLRGHSVLPGIVGMHDHLFAFMRPNLAADGTFDAPAMFAQMTFSAPRLYLANGVTTARTAASASPYADIRLKQAIEGGTFPGPHLDVTGPFLEGKSENPYIQIYQLTGPDDARQTVAYWAERGVTSFKAYAHITREELKAAADEAHKHGSKITGHLCSVTYEEAAELGIDNIEHGFLATPRRIQAKSPTHAAPAAATTRLNIPCPAVLRRSSYSPY